MNKWFYSPSPSGTNSLVSYAPGDEYDSLESFSDIRIENAHGFSQSVTVLTEDLLLFLNGARASSHEQLREKNSLACACLEAGCQKFLSFQSVPKNRIMFLIENTSGFRYEETTSIVLSEEEVENWLNDWLEKF